MSRHPTADALLALEGARDRVKREFAVPTELAMNSMWDVIRRLDAAVSPDGSSGPVVGEVTSIVRRTVRALMDAGLATEAAVDGEVKRLKAELWQAGPPLAAPGRSGSADFPARGHLRDLSEPGEPQLTSGTRYEPAPLVMPDEIGLGVARQGEISNCYFIAAVNAVAHRNPEALRQMVERDPDDENVVIVSVAAGTYRVPATLPVDDISGARKFATSSDGSTFVAYLEKAAAAHFGSWADLAGGLPVMVNVWLAGDLYREHNSFLIHTMTDQDVGRVVSSPVPGVVSVLPDSERPAGSPAAGELGIAANHGYTVEGTTADGRVQLHDPKGGPHPTPLSVQDLRDIGARLCWSDDKPHQVPRTSETKGGHQ